MSDFNKGCINKGGVNKGGVNKGGTDNTFGRFDPARRKALRALTAAGSVGLAGAAGLGLAGCATPAPPKEQHITMTVKRFEYSQKEIHVKRGIPVVVEIVSLDVPHGFSVPDFHVRAEVVMPGKPTFIRFTPDKTGEFLYVCDVFCGSGHEQLEGTLFVTAWAAPPPERPGCVTRAEFRGL
jgi:cytochrome c oxidase subunit 2